MILSLDAVDIVVYRVFTDILIKAFIYVANGICCGNELHVSAACVLYDAQIILPNATHRPFACRVLHWSTRIFLLKWLEDVVVNIILIPLYLGKLLISVTEYNLFANSRDAVCDLIDWLDDAIKPVAWYIALRRELNVHNNLQPCTKPVVVKLHSK